MGELDDLIKQKAELEKRIKELKLQTKRIGGVRVDKTNLYGKEGVYILKIHKDSFYKPLYNKDKYNKSFAIIEAENRDLLISKMEILVKELNEMLSNLYIERGTQDV